MSEPVLEAEKLLKVYGRKKESVVAAKDVSFTLQAGKTLGLVGESGSGKTTIGRLLTGIEFATSGTIQMHSQAENTSNKKLRKRSVQMIFQDPYSALNPFNTVKYTIMRPLLNYHHISKDEAMHRLIEILETVQLTPVYQYLEKRSDELSGGQRQRVVIARALAVDPNIIVADEPTSMLDVSIRSSITSLLNNLLKDKKVQALLYITHDLMSARQLADDLMVLYKGKVVEQGDAMVVIDQPKHPYTQLLLSAIPDPYRDVESSLSESDLWKKAANESVATKGCPFAPRCPLAIDRCWYEDPMLEQNGENREVACHVVNSP